MMEVLVKCAEPIRVRFCGVEDEVEMMMENKRK